MSTQFLQFVILTISYILSTSSLSSYRNNNNVIVVKSKVERMKGKRATSKTILFKLPSPVGIRQPFKPSLWSGVEFLGQASCPEKRIDEIVKEEITSLENVKFSYRENKLLSGKLARRNRRFVRGINFCNYYLCLAPYGILTFQSMDVPKAVN